MAENHASMDIKLFESSDFADCKVTCNGREFKTHRLILASRSQYFRKAFNGEWEESQTGEVKLLDHEPEKIEWLLRFIYHQDLEWHRTHAAEKGQDGFLPMLVELTILGDYFLVQNLIDAAQVAIVDVCSRFGVGLWTHKPRGTSWKLQDLDAPSPTPKEFMLEVMNAILLTSSEDGPTQPLHKFLVKLLVDFFGFTHGIGSYAHAKSRISHGRFNLATELRLFAIKFPSLKDEIKSALFDAAFPESEEELWRNQWGEPLTKYADEKSCSFCGRHLNYDDRCDEDEEPGSKPPDAKIVHIACLDCVKEMFTTKLCEMTLATKQNQSHSVYHTQARNHQTG